METLKINRVVEFQGQVKLKSSRQKLDKKNLYKKLSNLNNKFRNKLKGTPLKQKPNKMLEKLKLRSYPVTQ